MEVDLVAQSMRDALWISLQLGTPLLVALLVVGLAISVVQALTQIQEASLAFLPKLAVTSGGLLLLGLAANELWCARLALPTLAREQR